MRSGSISPAGPGAFVVPNWEAASQVDVRTGLMALAETLPDTKGLSGPRGAGDPVRRLIGAGAAWGGLPEQDALFVNVTPDRNDGRTVHRLTLKDVPVDGFWSVSVYDADGRFTTNPQKAYTVNSVTAEAERRRRGRGAVRRLRRPRRRIACRPRPTGARCSAFTGRARTFSAAHGSRRPRNRFRNRRARPHGYSAEYVTASTLWPSGS